VSAFHRYALILPVLTLGAAPAAWAQSSGYFMPPSAPAQSAPAHVSAPAQAPVAPAAPVSSEPTESQIPNLPPLPPETAPPTAIVGVLSVPDVMQQSTAAQGVQAEIQKRQAVLKGEEETAQASLQAEQQQILAERGKISEADFEKKVQDWQNEVATAQTKFQEKNQAIQNAGQTALNQIEAELIGIIRQEAQAHGMNLILHREQVVLNVAAFDLTDETVKELNQLLPSVKVPPSIVTPGMAITSPDQDQDQGQ
jgi:Skp family chaperone for outer membrane proteins